MIDAKHPKIAERTHFFMGIFLASFLMMVYLLQHYISTIIIASIFSISLRPLFLFIKSKFHLGNKVASSITLLIMMILVVLPLYYTFNHLLQELTRISADITLDKNTLPQTIRKAVGVVNGQLEGTPLSNLRIAPATINSMITDISKSLNSYFLDNVLKVGGASIQYIANLFIFLFLTIFLIPALPALRKFVTDVSPLHDDIDNMYINRTSALTLSLMKSFFIIALAQGILGGIFLAIAGFPYVLTFTIILMFASLIPYVGTNLIIIPISGYMLLQGNIASAAIILIGQVFFVTNIDNLLAAAILSHDTRLHPALMLLAIIGGLSVFGLTGILFGPMILILFLTSIEIYLKHYKY